MQIRVVRLNSRNPLVGILLLVVILALLAFVLTVGMALLAGGAVLGAVGYLARRLFGGRSLGSARFDHHPLEGLGEEVFPPAATPDANRPALPPPE